MTGPDIERDTWKQMVGSAAARRVEDGMIIGLGTGSTTNHFIHALARRVQEGLRIRGAVASSEASKALASSLGILVSDLDTFPEIDLYIDGADEIGPQLSLIKGGGGALLHEKIVASSAHHFIVIADKTKLVPRLGISFPVPIETVPFGAAPVHRRLQALGATVQVRQIAGKVFLTEERNFILDCTFPAGIADPADLDAHFHAIAGVVESGIFLNLAHEAIIAGPDGFKTLP